MGFFRKSGLQFSYWENRLLGENCLSLPRGEQVLEDLTEWAEGINAYEQTLPPPYRLPTVTSTDAIAGFAFIGSIFGNGGGGELTNSNSLARLQAIIKG